MVSPFCLIANLIRLRRGWLGWSQRKVARTLGCSQPYVAQVETGHRPVSRRIAEKLEILYGVPAGSYTNANFVRGRPPLTEETRQVLRHLREAVSEPLSIPLVKRAPRNPRSDFSKPREDALVPVGPLLGQNAAAVVRKLEIQRPGDERFWRGINSVRFDSLKEKLLVASVAQRCSQVAGVSLAQVGCALPPVNGITGRDKSRRAYPAMILKDGDISIAWYPQRCVRTYSGYRWPDNLLVAALGHHRVTVALEVDGAAFHQDSAREDQRDRDLAVPVLHLPASQVVGPHTVDQVFKWIRSLLQKAMAA
ncbi:helix-turn-helix transcriptional regulator [bacterium]|nr:helix-turn-helix transcriptional regulator [bacterium]